MNTINKYNKYLNFTNINSQMKKVVKFHEYNK